MTEYPIKCRLTARVGAYIDQQAAEYRVSRNKFLDALLETSFKERGIDLEEISNTSASLPKSSGDRWEGQVISVLRGSKEAMTIARISEVLGATTQTIRPVVDRLVAANEIEGFRISVGSGRPPMFYRPLGVCSETPEKRPTAKTALADQIVECLKASPSPLTIVGICEKTKAQMSTIKTAIWELKTQKKVIEEWPARVPGQTGTSPLVYRAAP